MKQRTAWTFTDYRLRHAGDKITMGMLIEIVFEFIADLFIADGNGKWEKLKQTKYERKLRKWAKEYEWFEHLSAI
ncbi:hypothetical protein [Paenibacillus sp. FSL A5-0031]|uniref:hypothetical protein n=2 Tax=Paenibacillus TaxID=44249 RepID=UPI00118535D0|nr:hypothetical protein [Paenibacillus sp. FSL A5-0031]